MYSSMNCLLQKCPWVLKVQSNPRIGISCLPDFALNSLKYHFFPAQKIEQLEAIFKKFTESSEDYIHAFLMGQTSHWLTIIINKVNGFTETLLFDSRNAFILGLPLDELHKHLNKKIRSSGKDENNYPAWKRDISIMSYLDTQHTITLFHNCAIGKYKIRDKLFDFFVQGFFELFETALATYVKTSINIPETESQNLKSDNYLIGFIHWLENFSPPALIEKKYDQNY